MKGNVCLGVYICRGPIDAVCANVVDGKGGGGVESCCILALCRLGANAFVFVPVESLVVRGAVLDELAPATHKAGKCFRAIIEACFATFDALLRATL